MTIEAAVSLISAMLTELDKKIIAAIQGDMPITPRPYEAIAERLQVSEKDVLRVLQRFCDQGIIRRFGATLRHQKSGYEANAMTAWQVAEDRIDAVGRQMADHPAISHCYRRDPTPGWPYNLYTMIHAHDRQSCRQTARQLSIDTGIDTYALLFSRKELKKTSMQYYIGS